MNLALDAQHAVTTEVRLIIANLISSSSNSQNQFLKIPLGSQMFPIWQMLDADFFSLFTVLGWSEGASTSKKVGRNLKFET